MLSLSSPVASEAFEDDNCSNFVSEDDSETQSVSSFSSGPTSPSEIPDQFPAVTRPGSLDLPSPVSLSEFGMMFPVLGPRHECSGPPPLNVRENEETGQKGQRIEPVRKHTTIKVSATAVAVEAGARAKATPPWRARPWRPG